MDANIILDYVLKAANKEEAIRATAIVDYCVKRSIPMLISTHTVMILSYFLTKELREANALNKLMQGMMQLFEVITVEKEDIIAATNSVMSDFEDAVQLNCALNARASLLITKNIADFYDTTLPIIPPNQFFDFI